MNIDTLMELYVKERDYQKKVFGDYGRLGVLNLASFLTLHREYLRKAEHMYIQKWDDNLPPWLKNTAEFAQQGSAPVKTYEYIIKNFVLHGAALETYTEIDPTNWRGYEINPKWKK